MADRTPDGVYADWNPHQSAYSVGVYRRPACLSSDDEHFDSPHTYLCSAASFKRIVRWMLESERAGAGRCFLEDATWCYESAWAVSQIAMDRRERDG